MVNKITEDALEQSMLGWLNELGYEILHGPDIAPGEPAEERSDYSDAILHGRLRTAVARINPHIPGDALDDALKKLRSISSPSLGLENRDFHHLLVNGIEVEVRQEDGSIRGEPVNLFDFVNPQNNDWVAVNQFTMIEDNHNRRPDVVMFINGLPIAVIELKNPADEDATIWSAFNQLQTYKARIPSLFSTNELLIISDGLESRIGSLTSNREWFMPWKTIDGESKAPKNMLSLEVLTQGIFEKSRLLDYIKHFITFTDNSGGVMKKIAGYHQFHATRKAIETTVTASSPLGDKRGGVVWHTQGSGKSLTMAFFTGKLVVHPQMENPTIVVITDRNDLDEQLFGTFTDCKDLLRQDPVQAKDRSDLREKLKVASGGVVFTTIQKFFLEEKGDTFPMLTDRSNVVVIADEAHRSQYDFIDGFARHMRDAIPNATFVGFTGTPIALDDRNTQAVFGDYISIYDIQQAVDDGATVPIYYESRLAKVDLDESEHPHIDPDFEEATEGEELSRKEKLKTKWAALEAIVGTEKRINLIAKDLIDHFENRLDSMEGKGMIVCMSRRICVELHDAIVKLRPDWNINKDDKGKLKVVMTGSASDPLEWQKHIRNKKKREDLAARFKDESDEMQLVIVRDMWLTGFDAPSLHTMYVDKPMQGHGLMQAIARVNRVFKDKPGGLVVDYIGLGSSLKKAMATYTDSGGKGNTALDQSEAVALFMEKMEICRDMFFEFDVAGYLESDAQQKLLQLPSTQEHILSQENGKDRFIRTVIALSKAFALSVPREAVLAVRDEVAFYQAVKAALVKSDGDSGKTVEELNLAVRQIVSKAVVSDGIVDIFTAAGLDRPDISILSDEFLADVKGLPQKNLAVEVLQKLLRDEIRVIKKRNVVQSRSFSELLEKTLIRYQNRAIETAQVIEELIELAKEMREAHQRGEDLGLSDDELAFYDALETNDSAVKVLGDDTLKIIAHELVENVRNNATIDWTLKESVQAKMRVAVKRILRKYGYPPDMQTKATETVLEQAELFADKWAA
ncbi:MAG: HsdR family type I site-specific deoxyribonuclease [Simkaniaceae bacterium]|nr:HsdR family type I site-specific deoxyribonuclease [Simkaniaceae bacterium]